jgi:Flp pilus assembly protein TadB
METALNLLALASSVASALALYLGSPNCGWPSRLPRTGLRVLGVVLALLSLCAWVAAVGVAPGLCAMLASWMLALVLLPYLSWWMHARGRHPPLQATRGPAHAQPSTEVE